MEYIVKSGDSLSKIARDVLGNISLWPVIAKLNNIQNPDLIFPGDILQLPEQTTTEPQSKAGFSWFGIGFISLIILSLIFVDQKK